MPDPIPLSEVPDDIGRNDPCPCGSGRKYKKCCQRTHELERKSAQQSRSPHDLIDADTIPWKVFQLLQQVEDNTALGLFWELGHDEGPFRHNYTNKTEFIAAVDAGELVLPAGPSFDLAHMRSDAPDTHLVIREDDPKRSDVEFQIVTLRPNELNADGDERDIEHPGFRIWNYVRERIDREDFDDVPPLETFGLDWNNRE